MGPRHKMFRHVSQSSTGELVPMGHMAFVMRPLPHPGLTGLPLSDVAWGLEGGEHPEWGSKRRARGRVTLPVRGGWGVMSSAGGRGRVMHWNERGQPPF